MFCSFNSRAHGGRDTGKPRPNAPPPSFNSRAHGGRDAHLSAGRQRHVVSIHAPTGGATRTTTRRRRRCVVSIHAPTGGATPSACTRNRNGFWFQFTRPRGARHAGLLHGRGWVSRFNSRAHGGRDTAQSPRRPPKDVSIHAPTGGATSAIAAETARAKFQFTRPRGARPHPSLQQNIGRSFNSRAHGGRDKTPLDVWHLAQFQFTRPRGARPARGCQSGTGRCFNSRAHGGRDLAGPLCGGRAGVSIHAPTGGATSSTSRARTRRASFNSRAHGGRDSKSDLPVSSEIRFNSRAHGGRD